VTTEPTAALARLIRSDGSPAEGVERDGRTAVFDGVLHERDELARELGLQSANDAELVLAAYLRWGEDAVGRLSGTFAWAVWDSSESKLLAARDQVGAWPLFYAEHNGGLVLSASLEGLLAQPGVSRELNRAALADHLCNRWPDAGETYYQAVRRVPPGHALRLDRSGSRVYRYWNPAPTHRPIRWVERDELERFESLMEQAVARPLELGQPGIFLSGGLDSVSVAAVAADYGRRNGPGAPLGLSVAFPDVEANEEAVQTGVAEQLGLEHVMLDFDRALGGKGLLEAAVETSASWPQPLANIWYPVYRPLADEGARRGCRVILTGGGGDEWLSVSPFLAADLMRRGDLRGLYSLWTTMHRSYSLSRLATLRSVLWTFGSRPVLAATAQRRAPRTLATYRRRRRQKLTPAWVAPDPALRRELEERADAGAEYGYEQGFYLREGQLSLDHSLVSMEMEELHESGRRSGLAMRMPFWDPDLVDFLYRTPPELLTEGGRAKSLVRRMLERRFPDLGFERHKKVLATNFFTRIMVQQGAEIWRTMEGPFALDLVGVVEKRGLNSLVRGIFAGEQLEEVSRFWNLISLEAWLRPRVTDGGG
jgi:asparagine synthase (glutamine-hydrolysing)